MGEKITRISITLPEDLLRELDRSLKSQDYASRSEAIRDAVRDFLTNYKWRSELEGELLGVVVMVYDHEVRGLTEEIVEIQHRSEGIIRSSQHLHLDERNCMETLLVKGTAGEIRKLVDRLGALRGVKQVKLVVAGA
ncbi:MAG: nickel-responsive transcriptional regulator NikR [Candidatus Hadarchaeales archaeon]